MEEKEESADERKTEYAIPHGVPLVGMRVIRGPDWRWDDQDGGVGFCGTIVAIGGNKNSASPEGTVVVVWDCGPRTNYRCGYDNKYDLRCIDNGPCGVTHPTIVCDSCGKRGVSGIRWKCATCYDYDLCTPCYINDKHELEHQFLRIDTTQASGVRVPPRHNASRIPLSGIFVGAKVTRGTDWDWQDQDGGGAGKGGRVVDIRGYNIESYRSVVSVTWVHSGATNIYRVGHKGKVDLKCLEAAEWGKACLDHFPIVGKPEEEDTLAEGVLVDKGDKDEGLKVGDKVKVAVSLEVLKRLQKDHGGWNPVMADYINRIGQVHRVTDKGNVRVEYEGQIRWTYHPNAIIKFNVFDIGDMVVVNQDRELVKKLQKDHGDWIDAMASILGKRGKVTKVYKDGDLRVEVDGKTWTLNPQTVQLIPKVEKSEELLLQMERCQLSDNSAVKNAISSAMRGRPDQAVEIFSKHPSLVNETYKGKTCLQIACHQGDILLIRLLLAHSARVDMTDSEGDTALHYAAYGDQEQVIQLLLASGAAVNTSNACGCTALHVAVNKQHTRCVKALLQNPLCNSNIQDSHGDTPLHDALGKEAGDIVDMLLAHPGIDLSIKNKRGFNVLHHAALKGDNAGVKRLVAAAKCLVDFPKDDGFAALHLAALNGHRAVAETLLTEGRADVNLRNKKGQTALHLAVTQGRAGTVELLVKMGADIGMQDDEGSTPVHLALLQIGKVPSAQQPTDLTSPSFEAPNIYALYHRMLPEMREYSLAVAIANYLVREGEPDLLNKCDRMGLSPLQLLRKSFESELVDSIERMLLNTEPADVKMECIVCSEFFEASDEKGLVTFEPCAHTIACRECSARMRKCIRCHVLITRKLTGDGALVQQIVGCDEASHVEHDAKVSESVEADHKPADRLRYLETKIQEIEEQHCCSICMERRRNVAFLCGHGACDICAATLSMCHMCRKPIEQKINLYN